MTSFKCVVFKPREGVEQAITNYMENTRVDGSPPQACRAIIRKEDTGFRFVLIL